MASKSFDQNCSLGNSNGFEFHHLIPFYAPQRVLISGLNLPKRHEISPERELFQIIQELFTQEKRHPRLETKKRKRAFFNFCCNFYVTRILFIVLSNLIQLIPYKSIFSWYSVEDITSI